MPSAYRSPEKLVAVSPRWTPSEGSSNTPETTPERPAGEWEEEARRLRTALEDVVALASGSAELRHRIIQMQRRATAALSGMDAQPEKPPVAR